ncbi:double-strand break repair protein MRE11 [Nematocida displodere]|uniref:Double-strand break repair protein MRE11 n=1 Tax=Nematocida displodere TaxID=1805483 RepID=A0A177ECU5_9MICR|nr:double-strand break repair protein MRE11 [Nematocida displodere]
MFPEDMRVLITTDNHLGYIERDPIRGEDSFLAFEEVFEHARRLGVDCVLICGDLFHVAHPSKYTMYRTMEILKKHCAGDREVQIECLDNENMKNLNKESRGPNYYSPNQNIDMPVFAIHGNHDEPSGHRGVASLDIFAEAGLVNYFGCIDSTAREVTLAPITLKKGANTLNLYGMGGIRDERMAKLFAEGRVTHRYAKEGTNVFVLHQTRCGASAHSYVPESLLSKELDLIVWGHMHESLPRPVQNHETGFYTVQPGSTVQTSLCQAESGNKHCVLLTISKGEWKTTPVPMQTPRRFIFKTLLLKSTEAESRIQEEMEKILAAHTEDRRPLVRLRVELDGEEASLIERRVLKDFRDRVANPKEVLRLVRRRKKEAPAEHRAREQAQFMVRVENTRILPETAFSKGINECIEREDRTAISRCYDEIVGEVVTVLKSHRWRDIDVEIPPAVSEVERRLAYRYEDPPGKKAKHENARQPREIENIGTNSPRPTQLPDIHAFPQETPGQPLAESSHPDLEESKTPSPKNEVSEDFAFANFWG